MIYFSDEGANFQSIFVFRKPDFLADFGIHAKSPSSLSPILRSNKLFRPFTAIFSPLILVPRINRAILFQILFLIGN